MDLSQLQAECGRLLNDPNNTRWVPDVLTARLNLAQNEVNVDAEVLKQTGTAAFVANQSSISAFTNIFNIIRVLVTRSNGSVVPLPGITINELDTLYPDWRQWTAGDPRYWYYDHTALTLNFVPAPDSTAAAASATPVSVVSVRTLTDMSASSDIPFGGFDSMVPFHMSLVHWTVAQCWMDDGTPEAMAKSKFHRSGDIDHPGMYELQIKRINQTFESTAGMANRIMVMPEGGRQGSWGPSKSYPLI